MGLREEDEIPGAFPQSPSPSQDKSTPTRRLAKHVADAVIGQRTTPTHAASIKPSVEEMHPQKYQMSTAKPLDEARWLGFSQMAPHTEPAKGANKIALAQGTPTKTHQSRPSFAPPGEYQFTFSRPSLGLGPEARQLLAEKKEEAAKIREQMAATQDSNPTSTDLLPRKMATPKPKVGRFSDVHMSAFKKMDSIANHPSAMRLESIRSKAATDDKTPKKGPAQPSLHTTQSLKRTQSKTNLPQSASSSSLPRSTSKRDLHQPSTADAPSKRVKRAIGDDATTDRPRSSGSDTPSTPKDGKLLRLHPANPNLSKGLSTPTAASLARASSVKSVKRTGIPALTRSPSKPGMTSASLQHAAPAPALLARPPSKMTLSETTTAHTGVAESKPDPDSPLLSRSPVKAPAQEKHVTQDPEEPNSATKIPYLSRSPSKKSTIDYGENVEGDSKPSKTPLLARSPSKIAIPDTTTTPVKSTATNLMSRFNLLRASPMKMKSILRTPQRLYSDDPLKVARGTHFATPERTDTTLEKPLPAPPKTAPVRKHVDFSASTKGNDVKDGKPDTPSKETASQRDDPKDTSKPAPVSFGYPTLPDDSKTTKKSHRRMTMALPSDFTFRADAGITFAPSPNRLETVNNLKASIRHVSADPEIIPAAAKKRKFASVGETNLEPSRKNESSDKENDAESEPEDEDRPSKKVKPNTLQPTPAQATKTPRKMPTLGVKPKPGSQSAQKPKDKRPGLLSRDRLNMLSMPKRR